MKTNDICEFWDRFGAVILVFGPTLIFYLFLAWLVAMKTPNETHEYRRTSLQVRNGCIANGRVNEGKQ